MDDPNQVDTPDENVLKSREIAVRLAREAASRGDSLAGMLSELERSSEMFYLGLDVDPDSSDLDVFP